MIRLAIALLGMYAFLRSIPVKILAAIFGALSFGLSGFFFGTMTNLPTFFVWSWAGVVGWAVLRLIRTEKPSQEETPLIRLPRHHLYSPTKAGKRLLAECSSGEQTQD